MKEAKDECGKKWGRGRICKWLFFCFLLLSFGEGRVVILKQRGGVM